MRLVDGVGLFLIAPLRSDPGSLRACEKVGSHAILFPQESYKWRFHLVKHNVKDTKIAVVEGHHSTTQ